MDLLTVSSKGQIVIPEKVRKHFNIKTGDKLVLFEKGEALVLKKEQHLQEQLVNEDKEHIGWMILGEQSLKKTWSNKKDDEVWKRYL